MGAWAALPEHRAVYEFAWTHPLVMLTGLFALLTAAAFVARGRAVVLGLFWMVAGATVGPLLARASDALHGGWRAGLAAVVAFGLALALFAKLRRESVSGSSQPAAER